MRSLNGADAVRRSVHIKIVNLWFDETESKSTNARVFPVVIQGPYECVIRRTV